jgi:hypothetical protein
MAYSNFPTSATAEYCIIQTGREMEIFLAVKAIVSTAESNCLVTGPPKPPKRYVSAQLRIVWMQKQIHYTILSRM